MYTDIKEIKATTARAYAAKIGSTTMMPIINKIKEAAASGRMEVRIIFKDYSMLNKNDTNIAYLTTWARLCGYVDAKYDDCLYIKWY
jgi:hypothetical protein